MSAPSRTWFAYSTLLDPEEFQRSAAEAGVATLRLPAGKLAEAPGFDLVYSVPSSRWGGRVATLVRKPGASVFGLAFEVPTASWSVLGQLEGDQFEEQELEVRVEGRSQKAAAFAARPGQTNTAGPVSQAYANTLARGAERAGLPSSYVTKLQSEALILDRVQGFGSKHHLK